MSWLEGLYQPGGFDRLLSEHDGCLVRSSYRLASVKLMSYSHSRPVPTQTELHVAAREIVEMTAHTEMCPTAPAMKHMAEGLGLLVL